jgi:hypothetical protein
MIDVLLILSDAGGVTGVAGDDLIAKISFVHF